MRVKPEHCSEGCISLIHFPTSLIRLCPSCHFDLGGIETWLGVVRTINRSYIKPIHYTTTGLAYKLVVEKGEYTGLKGVLHHFRNQLNVLMTN